MNTLSFGGKMYQPCVELIELTLQKVIQLEPKPKVFTPYTVIDLMQRVSAKHLVQRHVKAEVVKECILQVHQ